MPTWIYMLNKVKEIINVNILALILIPVIFYFFFGLNNYQLGIGISAGLIIYAISYYYYKFWDNNETDDPNQTNSFAPILIALGAVSIYFFSEHTTLIAALLLGVNIAFSYLQHQKFNFHKTINLFNIVVLTGIVFQSGITKFRGFNNLTDETTDFAVPVLLILGLTIYFLVQALYANISALHKPKNKKILMWIITLGFVGILSGLSYWFFREIGTETILVPMLAGIAGGVIELFAKPKSSIMRINSILLLTILPYRVAGLLGILLAFLIAYIYMSIFKKILEVQSDNMDGVIYKITPVLFLIAITEIRENQGLLTRFNLVTGYQIGWMFISAVIISKAYEYMKNIKTTLENNEMITWFAFITSIFTLALITFIIRFGRDESLAAFLIVSGIYLFIVNLVDAKKHSHNLMYISSAGNVIGAIAFLVLTRI